MIETPGPEDQNQEQPEPTAEQAPANPPETPIPQTEASPAPALPPEQAETDEQASDPLSLPIDELEGENADQEGEKQKPTGPDQEEAVRRKERLDKQARWREDISSEQQELIKQSESDRQIELGKRNISLKPIGKRDLQEADMLFVEPESYQDFVQHIEQSTEVHILIVAGQEHSGKLMTAIYLAQHVWQNKKPDVYLFTDRSSKSLYNVVANGLPSNAVILFDEALEKDPTMLDDLTRRFAPLNDDLINLGNVWFIFTVLHGPRLDALQARNFPTLHTTAVNRQQVMGKLIDYVFQENIFLGDQRAKLLKAKENLNPRLTPADLRQLFDTKKGDLPVLIEALTQPEMEHKSPDLWFLEHKAPDLWFNELKPMNYQLYALLVVLFDKLDMPMLEEIYTVAVNALRRQGMDGPDEFIDPRRIGTNLMHNKLGIQVRFDVLEFRNRIYRQYVEEQVENFQRLLWSLIDPDDPSTFAGLVGTIHGLSEYDFQLMRDGRYTASSDRLWQLRNAIAGMIAQVGVYHLNRLHILLDKLASDVSPLVSLTAAFVLAEIARRGKHFEFIETTLKVWYQSGRFELMWAAAASISFIYEAIARPLEDDPDEQDEQEQQDKDEDEKTTVDQAQKPRGKGHLTMLRDMLTDLVKIHDHFSEKAIDEERHRMYDTYRARLRQQLEATLEPVPDTERLFRDLNEIEQEQIFNAVYAENKKAIDEAIKRDIAALTNSWKNQMRIALVQTLGIIAQMWPDDVTRLVRVWLDRKDTESPLWQIGHMALNYLFRESSNMKDASRLEQSAYPLLKLLPMAMRTHKLTMEVVLHDMNLFLQIETLQETGTLGEHLVVGNLLAGDPLIYALYAIQRWYENLSQLARRQEKKKGDDRPSEEDEEDEEDETSGGFEENAPRKKWQQTVYAVLSDAMNSAPQEERQRLRMALFLWIKSGEQMLGHIARILISHSYVMDGIVLDLPISKRAGIVVVDNSRRDREDRENIFYLLQRLSSIAPLHLHWLGYTRSSRFLSSEDRKEVGKTRDAEKISSLDPDDLLLRGASRPSLLLPVLTSGQGQGYVPERSYFVAVFHTEPILDLEDLYPGFAVPKEEREGNIFKKLRQQREAAAQARNQPWQGKVYLLPSSEKFTTPAALSPLLTVVYPESFGLVEEELRRQVTMTLRSCSAEELWSNLRTYIGTPETQPRTFERLAGEIERWLEQLSDTSTLYPDVSLFILWTIMARSREDLAGAIQLIELLLREKEEGSEDKKKFRKLRQQMGIASTRMLFHFYGEDNPTLASQDYGILLDLLPKVMACASSYTEILPTLSVLFQLARTDDWLQLLNENEGAFFECISKVASKDIEPLRDWLKYDQQLIAMIRLFLDYNRPFSDFRAFGEDVFRRYKAPQPKRSARKEAPPPGEMASKFLAILPADDAQEEKARYTWAIQQIAFQEARLRNPDTQLATLEGLKNLEVLLNHLASELQARQDGTIKRLEQGEYYGVVMVEAQSKAAVHQAFLVLQEFVKQRRESKRQHITLMLQRLGEKEILARVRNNRKIKNEREISDKRKLPQVIGPLLERYPADQVAFVLMITANPIIDYDDWAEQDQWASRLWVARLGKWHPYRGEIAALGESTQLTLETLLKRSGGGIENHDYVSLLPDHAGTAANQSVQ